MEFSEDLQPPQPKRSRGSDEVGQDEEGGQEEEDDEESQVPAPSSWLPSAVGVEVRSGPGSVDSGLSGSATYESATPPPDDLDGRAQPSYPSISPTREEDMSELSEESGKDWKPDMSGKLAWLHRAMARGEEPRELLGNMLPQGSVVPEDIDRMTLWKVLFNLLSEPERREKLESVNTLEDVVGLIKSCSRILVLTGAGVSVSCGIPDFRSKDGVYARLAVDFPDLPDPQAMFDIHYFRRDPRPFFKFAREIYPGQFKPSPCHKFIANLEKSDKLLRNYTQNIDTLEQEAGINRVIQCHGSFATASCTACKRQVAASAIREDIFERRIPVCPVCRPEGEAEEDIVASLAKKEDTSTSSSSEPASSPSFFPSFPPIPMAVMKPDIVFFGEGLPDHFHTTITQDKAEADLLIVIGSSLKVRPVALIPSSLPPSIPQILINREPLPHCSFDVELLGDCDTILNQLCLMLGEGWEGPVHAPQLEQVSGLPQLYIDARTEWLIEERKQSEEREMYLDSKLDKEGNKEIELVTKTSDIEAITKDTETSKEDVSNKTATDEVINPIKEPSDVIVGERNPECLPEEPKAGGSKDNVTESDVTDKVEETEAEIGASMESLFKSRRKPGVAEFLPDDSFVFLPPARYIFSGAEVSIDEDTDSDEDDDSVPDEDTDVSLALPSEPTEDVIEPLETVDACDNV